MSATAVLTLAALALPRAVAHDLGPVDPVTNAVLALTPPAIWVAFVLWRRVRRPFVALAVVGAAYGVMLAITHQILWIPGFDGNPPVLGGNLEGTLTPAAESALLRSAAAVGSLVVGTLTGAVTGAVAWLLTRLTPTFRPVRQSHEESRS